MAADSDGYCVQTVVTCEGDLRDPDFHRRFQLVLNKLTVLLGDTCKVHKLEPWNSVRVTLSIPREAALRLRQLASDGSQQLRALGILSVQVEGDQVISLRLAGTSEPREIILQTRQGIYKLFRIYLTMLQIILKCVFLINYFRLCSNSYFSFLLSCNTFASFIFIKLNFRYVI